MKKLIIAVFIMVLAVSMSSVGPVMGLEKNLSVNPGMTAKIRAVDQAFFQGFDVYFAGASTEVPSVLLFDIKDEYQIQDRFWGTPLSEEEIIYAINRLDDQYMSGLWDMPFEPRALNVVNNKGETLGYIYTGVSHVTMDRKKDGRVIVYLPEAQHYDGGQRDGEQIP
jgi:hypothetical protein